VTVAVAFSDPPTPAHEVPALTPPTPFEEKTVKGTIVKCLEDLVKKNVGEPQWKAILEKSGHGSAIFMTNQNIPDGEVIKMLEATCGVLNIEMPAAMEAFGVHWSTKYAPAMYGVYFEKAKTAREFLLNLDQVHVVMTKNAGASPPRFTYEWKGEKELVMHYASPRGLVALMPGLLKGVGLYFKEAIEVVLKGNDVHVKFAR
jgi:hypothetical protein